MDPPRRTLRTIDRMVRQATLGGELMRAILRASEPGSGSEYRPTPVRSRQTLTERLERVLWSVTYWLSRARGGSRDER